MNQCQVIVGTTKVLVKQSRNQISEYLPQRRYGSFAVSFGPFPEALAKGKRRQGFKKKNSSPNFACFAPLRRCSGHALREEYQNPSYFMSRQIRDLLQ
jgi:hypothetical protein